MIPHRLFEILGTAAADHAARFPPTEIFNEGWMLRLVLDAMERLDIANHPLSFLPAARWYSEALLCSPFRPRVQGDALGEGFTNADAVIGHFTFDPKTKAGLWLDAEARQFVVVEAKMFSNLSKGTKNAPLYDQAARNVACMAEAIAQSGREVGEFENLGFFVLAPVREKRGNPNSNIEARMSSESIRIAVADRVLSYEIANRVEAQALREWEHRFMLPLVERLAAIGRLAVLSWEGCIEAITHRDSGEGAMLSAFYDRCLTYKAGTVR